MALIMTTGISLISELRTSKNMSLETCSLTTDIQMLSCQSQPKTQEHVPVHKVQCYVPVDGLIQWLDQKHGAQNLGKAPL